MRESKQQDQQEMLSPGMANDRHGMTDSTICYYFGEQMAEQYYSTYSPMHIKDFPLKFLVIEGEVKKVFCHFYSGGLCTSYKNPHPEKICHIVDEKYRKRDFQSMNGKHTDNRHRKRSSKR